MALVLIVEDNLDLREMYEEILLSGGHRAAQAETLDEALAALDAECPDAVLLDLGIQGGGDALVSALRARPDGAGVKVILASGVRDLGEIALEIGAAAYLVKPFTQEELLDTLDRVLR